MLSIEAIEWLKNDGYSFEQIESIKKWLKNIEEWKTISEEIFWSRFYEKINSKMKEHV